MSLRSIQERSERFAAIRRTLNRDYKVVFVHGKDHDLVAANGKCLNNIDLVMKTLVQVNSDGTYLHVMMTVFSPSQDGLSAMILACVVTSCGES